MPDSKADATCAGSGNVCGTTNGEALVLPLHLAVAPPLVRTTASCRCPHPTEEHPVLTPEVAGPVRYPGRQKRLDAPSLSGQGCRESTTSLLTPSARAPVRPSVTQAASAIVTPIQVTSPVAVSAADTAIPNWPGAWPTVCLTCFAISADGEPGCSPAGHSRQAVEGSRLTESQFTAVWAATGPTGLRASFVEPPTAPGLPDRHRPQGWKPFRHSVLPSGVPNSVQAGTDPDPGRRLRLDGVWTASPARVRAVPERHLPQGIRGIGRTSSTPEVPISPSVPRPPTAPFATPWRRSILLVHSPSVRFERPQCFCCRDPAMLTGPAIAEAGFSHNIR